MKSASYQIARKRPGVGVEHDVLTVGSWRHNS